MKRVFLIFTTFLFLIVFQINDAFGGDFCSAEAGNGSATATWTPDLITADYYRVYVWWKADPEAATDAPYTVYFTGGSEPIPMNQQTGGGQWNLLGTWPFDSGISGYVVLSNDANGKVIADAVKFVSESNPGQEIIIDNNDATYTGTWTCSEAIDAYSSPDVTCSFTPFAYELSKGSTLTFKYALQNNTDVSQTFYFATRITLPNGNSYPSSGWLLGPSTFSLGPGGSTSQLQKQFIPYNAPFGIYTYHGYVGNPGPVIYHECQFNFEVTPY